MKSDRKNFLIRLSMAFGLQQTTIKDILLSVTDPLQLVDPDVCKCLPVKKDLIEKIRRVQKKDIQRFGEFIEREGIDILSICDEKYPPLLRMITAPPGILFVKGRTELISLPSVCVVGSRLATMEGTSIAENIARDLVREGIMVVSGLARGIDQAAHRGALDVGGKTAAVLGCGPDVKYPKECVREYKDVASEGAIVSEFPPGTQPRRGYFPRRNRIMSGMSMGVTVIEAAARSGALITSDYALEEGREVFAVPGSPLNPLSRGTNRLIKEGAIPVETGYDIIEALKLSSWLNDPQPPVRGHGDVMKWLGGGPKSIDELTRLTGKETSVLLSNLLELEVSGNVQQLPGMRYARRR